MARTQAKILGMGLRGPGTDSRAAETHGGADGKALRSRAADLTPPPKESELNLRAPRVQPPDALKGFARPHA